jgi:hypothetical protein
LRKSIDGKCLSVYALVIDAPLKRFSLPGAVGMKSPEFLIPKDIPQEVETMSSIVQILLFVRLCFIDA